MKFFQDSQGDQPETGLLNLIQNRNQFAIEGPKSEEAVIEMSSKTPRSASRSRTARSTSRSRASSKKETSKKDTLKKMVTPPSKSPSRNRGRPKSVKKVARQASKSPSPRKRTASRSRSRSRGRQADPAASSSKKVPKEKKAVIESTHEVADEDEEFVVTSTPQRRSLRNLTQEPPRTRSRAPVSPHKTFASDDAASASATTSSTAKTQVSAILSTVKSKALAAHNWLVALLTTVFLFVKRAIVAPFNYLQTGWQRVKPADPRVSAIILVSILVAITAVVAYFNPKLTVKAHAFGEKHIAVPVRKGYRVAGAQISEWSEQVSKWAEPKLKALGWGDKGSKAN
uniref:Uncharacterized protein n=1 Tax=Caenorhabditis japonica TaxID=281687 RepID=A0A8R1DFW5_CAEJA